MHKDYFSKDDKLLLWGGGRIGKLLCDYFQDLPVCAFIDNNVDKQGKTLKGKEIYSFDNAIVKYPDAKIILSLVRVNSLRSFLSDMGYVENEDFFTVHNFIPRYSWSIYRKRVPFTSFIPTTNACTQKCNGCLAYIPYSKRKVFRTLEEMKADVDVLFKAIDESVLICTSNGEQFLHPNIIDLWEYIYRKYHDRYYQIVVVTNTSILPKDEDFVRIKQCGNIMFSLSDYSDRIEERSVSLQNFIEKLQQFDIKYFLNVTANDSEWDDLGDPMIIRPENEQELANKFRLCSVTPGGVYNKKIFLCMQEAWANLNVSTPLYSDDYYNYLLDDDEKLTNIVLRQPGKGFLEFCRHCNGRQRK